MAQHTEEYREAKEVLRAWEEYLIRAQTEYDRRRGSTPDPGDALLDGLRLKLARVRVDHQEARTRFVLAVEREVGRERELEGG